MLKHSTPTVEPAATDRVEANILIVEDDEILRQILCDLLELKRGYHVDMAGTGQEALDKAKERFFNVVLLDLTLPDMEGLDLLRQLKKIHPATQGVILTGHDSEEIAADALGKGAFAYLVKPSSADDIMSTVERALSK